MQPIDLPKSILVMGAAGRLGRAIVEKLLLHGAQVVALDQDLSQLQELYRTMAADDRLLCVLTDLTEARSLQAALEQGLARFKKIDGAVNAAYPRNKAYGKPFLALNYDDFSENLSLHLGGYFLFMQHCVAYALDAKQPFSLVNLSSIYGSMAPRFDLYQDTQMTMPIEYAAIKAGLEQMVRYVTAYTKGSQFRVNCVSPGGILAEQEETFLKRYHHHCRSKGMLEPKDIVGTILFLLSDASEYLCGQNIIVDDGFHL